MGNPFNKLTNLAQMTADAGRRAMQYQGRTRLGNEDRADWRAQQRAQQERGFEFKPYAQPQRAGEVPISIRYGTAQTNAAAAAPAAAKVPRERWVRSYAAQQQGPRPDGQTPGMPPFVGPYAGNSQQIPPLLDPRTKRYTPGSVAEYRTWLDGSAFNIPENQRANAQRDAARALSGNELLGMGANPYGQDMANYQTPSYYSQDQQAAIQRWQSAMDIPDAVSRAATRNTATAPDSVGRSIADAATNVYDGLKSAADYYGRAQAIYDSYRKLDAIRFQHNRGAPDDNGGPPPAPSMPAYQGDGYGGGGYGGYGGGGGGGYSPTTRKWLNNMASWRI